MGPAMSVAAGDEALGEPGRLSLRFSAFDQALDLSALKRDVVSLAGLLERSMRESLKATAVKTGRAEPSTEELEALPRAPFAWSAMVMKARWDLKATQ